MIDVVSGTPTRRRTPRSVWCHVSGAGLRPAPACVLGGVPSPRPFLPAEAGPTRGEGVGRRLTPPIILAVSSRVILAKARIQGAALIPSPASTDKGLWIPAQGRNDGRGSPSPQPSPARGEGGGMRGSGERRGPTWLVGPLLPFAFFFGGFTPTPALPRSRGRGLAVPG